MPDTSMAHGQDVETVVVGGGQAGLAASCHLSTRDREHVVLERGRVGERWRSERWDSFTLQGPNWTLDLPDWSYAGTDPDGFTGRDALVDWLGEYARHIRAPLRSGTTVESLDADPDGHRWLVRTDHGTFRTANVIVATGAFERPYVPTVAADLPPAVAQVAALRYQNPGGLPDGAVLVVGGGASAYQIAAELVAAGRTVFLSLGLHDRVPRRYRGKDVVWWLTEIGEFDRTDKTVATDRPTTRRGTGPGLLLTGVDGGSTLDFRRLALDGLTLLGHLVAVDGTRLSFAPDGERVLAKGDVMFDRFVLVVDHHVRLHGLDLPEEAVEVRAPGYVAGAPIETLDLRAAGITSVVWATGLQREYPWLRVPVLDEARRPVHTRGVTAFPGLYFLGLTWQSRLLSPFINGVGSDADHVVDHLDRRMATA